MATEFQGLTDIEAKKLLIKFGPNELSQAPPPSSFSLLISQLKSPLVYILLGAGVITAILGDFSDTIIITFAVIINTALGFVQEKKAGDALRALKNMLEPKATVIRNGSREVILAEEIVPGDILVVNHGDKVPADGKVLHADHLFVAEAILTGESSH